MPEPRVGMKFSTHNEMKRKMKKKNPVIGFSARHPSVRNRCDSWAEVNGKNIVVSSSSGTIFYNFFGRKIADQDLYWELIDETDKDSGTYCESTLNYKGLKYEGKNVCYKDNNQIDIPYTKIYGDKTYAFDYNGNGVVDKGEIFYKIN